MWHIWSEWQRQFFYFELSVCCHIPVARESHCPGAKQYVQYTPVVVWQHSKHGHSERSHFSCCRIVATCWWSVMWWPRHEWCSPTTGHAKHADSGKIPVFVLLFLVSHALSVHVWQVETVKVQRRVWRQRTDGSPSHNTHSTLHRYNTCRFKKRGAKNWALQVSLKGWQKCRGTLHSLQRHLAIVVLLSWTTHTTPAESHTHAVHPLEPEK